MNKRLKEKMPDIDRIQLNRDIKEAKNKYQEQYDEAVLNFIKAKGIKVIVATGGAGCTGWISHVSAPLISVDEAACMAQYAILSE